MAHAACRDSRAPRMFRNTASASPRRAQRSGSRWRRPDGPSQSASAAAAWRPNGTIRSFDPLPNRRTSCSSRSKSPSDRPQASEIRAPVA